MGVAGMAISLVLNDCEDMLSAVSLNEGDDAISMAEEFFFNSNPRLSAKIAWNEILKQFQITVGMLMGNVMCRRLCAGRPVEDELLRSVREFIISEGAEQCSLENDESDALYNKNYRYYYRLFSHPGVAGIARDFAGTLRMQRRMTAGEVVENLRRLTSL